MKTTSPKTRYYIQNNFQAIANEIEGKFPKCKPMHNIDDYQKQIITIKQDTPTNTKTNGKQTQQQMTDKISELMDDIRKQKNKKVEKYNNINKEIRRKVRIAKQIWYSNKCSVIKELGTENKRHV